MPFSHMQDFTFKHSEQQDAIYTEYTAQQIKALFDSRGDELRTALNLLITNLNSTDGASSIGINTIQDLDGVTIQEMLKSVRDKLKSKIDGSSGADFVNATTIDGLAGETVQAILEALKLHVDTQDTENKNSLSTHKTSTDHDTRYYTKDQLQSITNGSSGADLIKATPINVNSGNTVQSQLRWLLDQIATAAIGSIPDGSISEPKLTSVLLNKINSALSNTGLLQTLITDDKSNLVNAVNEVKEQANSSRETLENEILNANVQQVTLSKGENIIASKEKTPINVLSLQGKTDIIEGQGFRGIVNPTIEVGNTRHTLETTLHGMNGVYDEILRESGVVKKVERFKEMVLDGSLNWAFSISYTGYKRVKLPISNAMNQKGTVSKYDGEMLELKLDNEEHTSGDQFKLHNDGNLYITITNTDSGWGDSYTPTADEIKAYFLGWKMYVSGSGADSQYNGTGTKGWVYRRTDGSYSQGYSVLPTTKAPDYNSYRLLYQKSQPETITVSTQDTAMLDVGENTVKVTQGVVVREKANVGMPSLGTLYYINIDGGVYPAVKGTELRYKAKSILNIYKNDDSDTHNWNLTGNSNSYGMIHADIPKEKFDTTATYYVTYEILPELTAQADNVKVEYSQNIKSIVEEHTEQLAVHQERLDNAEKTYAKKDEPAQWITPTLLNGWTTPSRPVRFTKDSLDFVHLDGQIVGGTNQTTTFVLPKGYRPSRAVSIFAVKTDNTSTTQFNVNSDGSVTVYNPSGTGTINFIGTFKAEQ